MGYGQVNVSKNNLKAGRTYFVYSTKTDKQGGNVSEIVEAPNGIHYWAVWGATNNAGDGSGAYFEGSNDGEHFETIQNSQITPAYAQQGHTYRAEQTLTGFRYYRATVFVARTEYSQSGSMIVFETL